MESNAFIKPPEKIPFYLKIGLLISRMIAKKDLLFQRYFYFEPLIRFWISSTDGSWRSSSSGKLLVI